MSYSRESLVPDMQELHVDFVCKDGDEYGHIPFKTELKGRDAVVYGHNGLIAEAQGSYIIDLEPEEVIEAFVSISVANALLRRRLEHA